MVEMSLVIPIFLVLFVALFEYGFMLFKNVSITNGTREAVRKASMNAYTNQQIKDFVKSNAVGVSLTDSDICITTQASDSSYPGAPPSVTLRVTHDHQWFVGGLVGLTTLRLGATQKAVVITYVGRETVTFSGDVTCTN